MFANVISKLWRFLELLQIFFSPENGSLEIISEITEVSVIIIDGWQHCL